VESVLNALSLGCTSSRKGGTTSLTASVVF
jgi:hypothetical protein